MEREIHKRASVFAAAAVSLLVFAGCSNQSAESPEAKKAAIKKQAEVKAKEIAALEARKKAEVAKQEQAKKQIPRLLAESDSALKLSEQFKNLAAKTKDQSRKHELMEKSNKAQKIANEKSLQIVTIHKSIYEASDQVRQLDNEIAVLSAQRKHAEQLASGNVAPASTSKKM